MKRRLAVIAFGLFVISIIFADNIYRQLETMNENAAVGAINQNTANSDDSENADASEVITYYNSWINDITENMISAYTSEGNIIELALPKGSSMQMTDDILVADIETSGGYVSKISIKRGIINDAGARLVTDEIGKAVESDVYGRLEVSDNFCAYEVYDEEKSGNQYMVFEEEKVCALITVKDTRSVDVGVVIKNNDYSSIYHDTITLKSESGMTVLDSNDDMLCSSKEVTLSRSGNEFSIDAGGTSIRVKTGDKVKIQNTSDINITSMPRCGEQIEYEGDFNIFFEGSGMVLVNTLNIEEYIKGVVAGEMPQSFDSEALKAQAVCARTFVADKISSGNDTYSKYGAVLDDSTSYQVYNSQPHSEKADDAVEETAGWILTYDDVPAKVFYFSTSCGYTSSAEDVFGGVCPYMVSAIQTVDDWQTVSAMVINSDGITGLKEYTGGQGQIQSQDMKFSESQFREFLQIKDNFLESDCPWFSWTVSISGDNLTKMLKNAGYVSGNVTGLTVTERGKGGVVTQISVSTESGNVIIENQNTIRKALAPVYDTILKNDGSNAENLTMLPSAYFYIDKTGDNYVISGGGLGHGVGMSQYGADAMAQNGSTYKQILIHYFYGANLSVLYDYL